METPPRLLVRLVMGAAAVLILLSFGGAVWIWTHEPLDQFADLPATAASLNAEPGAPVIGLKIFVESVDPVRQSARLLVAPRTYEADGSTWEGLSGWVAQRPIKLDFDGATEDGPPRGEFGEVNPGYHEPYVVTVHASGSSEEPDRLLSRYPFDSYTFMFLVRALYLVDDGTAATAEDWKPMDIRAQMVGSRDANFEVTPIAWDAGDESNVDFGFQVDRPWVHKVFAGLVMAVVLTMVVLLILMMWRVLATRIQDSRPPAMQALIWAAALTFTAVQIRDNYPGDPPVGIAADFVFVVPALIASIAVAGVLLHEWSRRRDFDTAGQPRHELMADVAAVSSPNGTADPKPQDVR